MADNIDALKRRRTVVKSNLTRFKNFLNGFNIESDDVEDLKCRLERASALIDEFLEIETSVFSIEDNEGQFALEMENFESSFYTAISKAKRLINEKATSTLDLSNVNQLGNNVEVIQSPILGGASFRNQVKLPTINIPNFSGAFEQWLHFRDTYKSLIHDHAVLSKIEKFHYLRSALSGEAADQIQSLETTEANYDIAWELLQERYENQSLIIGSHLDAIFDIPALHQESYVGLRQLHANVEKHLRSLKALGLPVDSWDIIIMHIVSSKLDPITLRDWKGIKHADKIPTIKEMFRFFNDRCQVLQSIKKDNSKSSKYPATNSARKPQSSKALLTTDEENCILCKGSHAIKICPNFLKLSAHERIQEARKIPLCLNCLKRGHKTRHCQHKMSCNICHKRHNTILHLNIENNQNNSSAPEVSTCSVAATCNFNETRKKILLATALVKVTDNQGNFHEVRALLDSGSQSNFASQNLCDTLHLIPKQVRFSVSGIGSGITKINKKLNINIRSRVSSYKATLSCLVLPQITSNIPGISFDFEKMNIPNDLCLADPEFNQSGPIDLLIGASLFWDLLCQGQVRLGRDLPMMQKTHLGWIISGFIVLPNHNSQQSTCFVSLNDNVDADLRHFWEIEERFTESKPLTLSEEQCEYHFQKTTFRASNGQFVVSYPFEVSKDNFLGDSKQMAIAQFHSMERKLSKNSLLKVDYDGFMREYIDEGHMTEIEESDNDETGYYIPHHPVIKPDSLTTKLRVVFNASAKTTNGKSLNDVQLVGPTIQRDIFSILLAFRKYAFAFTADIAKMYRMVLMNENDRVFQRIFWRFDSSAPLRCYELNTVTYGTASASFLAIRCLSELAKICKEKHPLISDIILNCFSVDDCLSGADSLDDLIYIFRELSSILSSAGFQLRKWSSNNSEFLSRICVDQADNKNFVIPSSEGSKALGLIWNRETDQFSFCSNLKIKGLQVTKRQILSCIAQIYDPLGLIAPIITIAKIILQRLWQLNLSWDEAIPLDLHTKWLTIRDGFIALDKIRVPRHAFCTNPVRIELHAFGDASELAYGACVYIRSSDAFSNVTVRLLASKGRVAPLKSLSIPRLELCAALILSQLVVKIRDSLGINFNEQFCWSDSTVTLAWIKGCPSRWKTFVSNRVAEIQGNVNVSCWRHICGIENPADLLSRGVEPKNLIDNELWWHGPAWLALPMEEWPSSNGSISQSLIPEQKSITLLSSDESDSDTLFDKFSNLSKLYRVVACCLRFAKNVQSSKENRLTGELSTQEILLATISLVKLAQRERFAREISILSQGRELQNKGILSPLSLFLDNGILRVGGRLKNSPYNLEKKHPILLPRNHKLTQLIIKHEHERLLHAGPQAVLASIRQRYWPIRGKNQVKAVIGKCYTCFRAEPKSVTTYMGDLPASRVTPTRPFLQCGIDYAGPFLIKDRKLRGAKLTKAYICLFICFATKVIHLELVGDLRTETFILALRRFASRRGNPVSIYSDNGTNFVGAERELSELFQMLKCNEGVIAKEANQKGTQWHFIPPRSPHFGGLWEAGVKSTKAHLKRVLASSNMTYEEFSTVLVQIEGCLNSRPLSPLSEDPNDLQPLTPAHFLIGEPLTNVPDPNLIHIPENRLSRFQRAQLLLQQFWKRWSLEYLSELQTRSKWRKKEPAAIKIGSLVVLKEDNTGPAQWRVGRVVEAYPGKDGISRVFSIRTAIGVVKRAANKLCPLPDEDDSRHATSQQL